jgi:hypothetical protein
MTEQEFWAVTGGEVEEVGDVRLHGLADETGWREMRNALPNVGIGGSRR